MDVLQVDSVKLEVLSNRKTEAGLQSIGRSCFWAGIRVDLYTLLGTQRLCPCEDIERRCGERDAWDASCFPRKLPMGTVPRAVGTQYFRHLTGFSDESWHVD